MIRRIVLAGVTLAVSPWLAGCLDGGGSSGDAGLPAVTLDGGGPPVLDASGVVLGAEAGAPSATVLGDATLDFGLVDCGGFAPANQTITVKNVGGATVHYAAGLTTTDVFRLFGQTSGDVAPGDSVTVTVEADAVPASATAGQVDQATLTVTTNDPAHPTLSVALKRTARGATFTLAPATVAFGDVPVRATSAATPLTLTNTGNAPADVTIGAASDPQFGLTWAGADGGATTLAPGATLPSLAATFAPKANGPAAGAAQINVNGAVCGASVSSIPMTGNGTVGVVAVSPGTLDFGKVHCGATGKAAQVTVSNAGKAPFNWTATIGAGASSPFTFAPSTGNLAAGATATITVTPRAIPNVATVAANAFGDRLRITSDALGDANHDVSLTQTAQGAVLAVSASSLAFGSVNVAGASSLPLTVTNTGNLGATVTLATSGGPFSVSPTAATAVSAGGSPLAATGTFRPAATGAVSGSLSISTAATDVLCSAPLAPIALSGTGINGTLSVSAKGLDFGSVACGQAAGAQTFDVANTGTASFSWSAALGKGPGSPYALAPSAGTLAPGAKATVTVTPTAIPQTSALTANLYGDSVTITPSGIAGGTAQVIALTETAKGAIVTASPASIPFGTQPEGQPTSATLTLKNSGTMPVTVTPAISGGNTGSFSLGAPGAHLLAAGANYSPGPTFTPASTGSLSSSVALSVGANDVLCQPLPAAVTLSGTGINGALALGAASVAFTAQPCGGAAQTATLKVSNTGSGALAWSAQVLGSNGFSVSPATGSLPAGGSSAVTVTGPTFPTTLGNVTPVTDTLRFTTNAFGDGNHDVGLSSTPSGAILALSPSGLSFPSTQANKSSQLPFTLTNNGNVAATVGFALTGSSGEAAFSFNPQNATASGGGSIPGTATFAPTFAGTLSDTMSATVPAGTPLCGALPSIPVSGTGTAGVIGGVPTGMSFQQWCNEGAPAQRFVLTNSGSGPYDFTASNNGGGFTVTPTSGTVDVGKGAIVMVTFPAVVTGATPGTASSGTLTVTTDIPGDAPHNVPVSSVVDGATLAFVDANGSPQPKLSTLDFVNANTGTLSASTFVRNTGNAASADSLVVPDPNNPKPPQGATPILKITTPSASPSTLASGSNPVGYTWYAGGATYPQIYSYDVYFPSSGGQAGICSVQAHQTVTFEVNAIQ